MKNAYGILFPTSVVGSMPRPDFVRDLIADDANVSAADYQQRLESAVRYVVASRKTRPGQSLRMGNGAQELHRRDPEWPTASSSAPRPTPAVDDRRRNTFPKNPGTIAMRSDPQEADEENDQGHPPAPALLGERMWDPANPPSLSQARGLRPRHRSDSEKKSWSCCAMPARRSFRSMTRTCVCSSIPPSGPCIPTPSRPRIFAVRHDQ